MNTINAACIKTESMTCCMVKTKQSYRHWLKAGHKVALEEPLIIMVENWWVLLMHGNVVIWKLLVKNRISRKLSSMSFVIIVAISLVVSES